MIPRKKLDVAQLTELWATDLTTVQIAARLDCTDSHVSHEALRAGLPRRAVGVGSLPQRRIVKAYVDHGMSMNAITLQLRAGGFPTLSETTVKAVLLLHGVTLRLRNAQPAMSRAPECLRLLRAGMHHQQIANELGMTLNQVRRRLNRLIGVGRRGQVGLQQRQRTA